MTIKGWIGIGAIGISAIGAIVGLITRNNKKEENRKTINEIVNEKEENEHLRKSREIMERMDYANSERKIEMLKEALNEAKKALEDLYKDDESDMRMSLD